MSISLQHVNLCVPEGTLHLAEEFYGKVLGFEMDPVPKAQQDFLRWIGDGPQQIHVAFEREPEYPRPAPWSSAHPCFALTSQEDLLAIQTRIWNHHKEGKESSALVCDEPGKENSGSKGPEYPTRFFARDYAGNKLEFSAPGI